MITLHRHTVRLMDGQPKFLLSEKNGEWTTPASDTEAGGKLWLGPSGQVHRFHIAKTETEGGEWFSWRNLPQMSDKQIDVYRESFRYLPALFDRSWICAITGCKDKSKKYSEVVHQAAFEAGRLAALSGLTVLTGGLTGVMSRAAEGARSVGGQTIGILPSSDHKDGNKNLDLILPSGIGYARNFLVAAACDVMISLPGGTGTMEELCFAIDMNRDVISWGGYEIDEVKAIPIADSEALQERLRNFTGAKFKGITHG